MPCRNPCRLYYHLAFTDPVGPSSIMRSELGPAPPFPPMRMLKCNGHGLNLVCEVALREHERMNRITSFHTPLLTRASRGSKKWVQKYLGETPLDQNITIYVFLFLFLFFLFFWVCNCWPHYNAVASVATDERKLSWNIPDVNNCGGNCFCLVRMLQKKTKKTKQKTNTK